MRRAIHQRQHLRAVDRSERFSLTVNVERGLRVPGFHDEERVRVEVRLEQFESQVSRFRLRKSGMFGEQVANAIDVCLAANGQADVDRNHRAERSKVRRAFGLERLTAEHSEAG